MEAEWPALKLLITGSGGLFGSKLSQTAIAAFHEVYSTYNKHPPHEGTPIKLDVTDRNQVERVIQNLKPDAVVHAAALTDVDLCETNKPLAWTINVDGTRHVAEASSKYHVFFLFISTDYVFNGEKGLYKETDEPAPINYYGITKLKAEEQVEKLSGEHCTARTSVIFGSTPAAGKENFALWLQGKLKSNQQVKILTDQWNSPTLNTNLAEMTLEIAERKLTGTYHLAGATRLTRYDFSLQLANTFNLNKNLITTAVSSDFQWPAKRPRDSSLSTEKAQQMLKHKPLKIDQALEKLKQETET